MTGEKLRELDTSELERQVGEAREQLFRLRFQLSMGQADGLKKLRILKKDRARILGILRQRELSATAAPAAAAPVSKGKRK